MADFHSAANLHALAQMHSLRRKLGSTGARTQSAPPEGDSPPPPSRATISLAGGTILDGSRILRPKTTGGVLTASTSRFETFPYKSTKAMEAEAALAQDWSDASLRRTAFEKARKPAPRVPPLQSADLPHFHSLQHTGGGLLVSGRFDNPLGPGQYAPEIHQYTVVAPRLGTTSTLSPNVNYGIAIPSDKPASTVSGHLKVQLSSKKFPLTVLMKEQEKQAARRQAEEEKKEMIDVISRLDEWSRAHIEGDPTA